MITDYQLPPGRPAVSIIMPVFNEFPGYLNQSIISILNQTIRDFEFIIVDDGSTNLETLSVLKRFIEADHRIKLLSSPHGGAYKARNAGLDICRGEYLCFQDSDDWSESTRIEKQVKFLEANPSVGCVGCYQFEHQENGAPLWIRGYPTDHVKIVETFEYDNPFCTPSVCFRNSIVKGFGGFRGAFNCAEDYDFMWRFCELSLGANIGQPLYHYRRRLQSITASRYKEKAQVLRAIRILAGMRKSGLKEDVAAASKQAEKDMSGVRGKDLTNRADVLMFAGHYGAALKGYLSTILSDPYRGISYMKLLRLFLFIAFPGMRHRMIKSRGCFFFPYG